MKKMLFLSAMILMIAHACTKNNQTANADCSTSKSYAADVAPVIASSCSYNSSCHGTGSNKGPGPLVTYQQLYNNRTSIRQSVVSGSMPESGNLSSASLSAIVCWIDAGALDN